MSQGTHNWLISTNQRWLFFAHLACYFLAGFLIYFEWILG